MIIAEIAQAHDGSLGILHSYIDALKDSGVDAIKFQTHIAAAESSAYEPFRINFSYEDATRYDYWKRMEFTLEQWQQIKEHCEQVNLEFISSPFSNAAVDLLEKLNVKKYKIGSGEISNHLLLEKIALTGRPVILSTGLSTWNELDAAIHIFQLKQIHISLLQCTTAYPTGPEQWGLKLIAEMKQRYNLPVGYSDHSGNIYASLAAAALGAELFEFHVVFHKQMFGPDTKASLEINEVKKLADGIKQVQESLRHYFQKDNTEGLQFLKNIFEKSLAINQNISKGTIITFDMLEAKKPKGYGFDAKEFKSLIGKKLKHDKMQWDFLKEDDVE